MAESFDAWLAGLPAWLQTAAAGLLTSQAFPDQARVTELADLCLAEEAGEKSGFSSVPPGAFDLPAQGIQVRLKRIESLTGVNALDASAKLDFGSSDLGVVYGHNGTGKSGFAKLTKHAASPRITKALLPDVFKEEAPEVSADFVLERDGQEVKATWRSADGPLAELRSLHVFDAEVARFYMTEKAEASYEPRRLRFLTALVDICDRVKADLLRRRSALVSSMPAVPGPLSATSLATFVTNLKATHTPEQLLQRFKKSETHGDRAKSLQEALLAPDPATKAGAAAKALTNLAAVRGTVEALKSALSAEKIQAVCVAASNAVTTRQAAKEAAASAFAQANLPGVGEATWRVMWEAAREYSTKVAYPMHAFPHTKNSVCPLCQQPITEATGSRLAGFESFVRGKIEAKADAAEATHRDMVQALPRLPEGADWAARFAQVPEGEQLAEALRKELSDAIGALATAVVAEQVPPPKFNALEAALELRRARLQAEVDLLGAAQKEGERAKLEAELHELHMLDWCSDNQPAILKELGRLKQVSVLDAAIKRTNTAPLTKKKNELAQDELAGGYRTRFEAELMALNAKRIKVAPVEAGRGAKGRISFSLAITGAKRQVSPIDVLSEGEARVVALAAFLADVTVAGARTPFVFDDPVSSLDIEFEERVAERLVSLSKTRQVVVFTHRLSLLTLLKEAIRKENTAAKQVEAGKLLGFKEVSLRRLEGRIGLVTEANVLESKVDKALNDLVTRRLSEAKKLAEKGEVDAFTALMKGICSDLRILTERAIEEELLGGVVIRFRRALVTKDKLTLLAKISLQDCELLDGLMTRLSSFEHAQSPELPAVVPTYDGVLADANALKAWVAAFRDRAVPPEKA